MVAGRRHPTVVQHENLVGGEHGLMRCATMKVVRPRRSASPAWMCASVAIHGAGAVVETRMDGR